MGVVALPRRQVRRGRQGDPGVPDHERRSLVFVVRPSLEAPVGLDVVATSVGDRRPLDCRTHGAGHDLGGDVGNLVVTDGEVEQDPLLVHTRERVVAEVVGVAVALAAVPEHLEEQDAHALVVGGRVGDPEPEEERVEVDAAVQQRRVVDGRHPEHRQVPVGGHCGGDGTHDPTLADPVVGEPVVGPGADQRLAVGVLEGGVGGEPVG